MLPSRPSSWLLTAALALSACSPARRELDGNIVKSIHFDGNGGLASGHNDYQLRSQMSQQATAFGLQVWPLMYFVDPIPYVESEVLRDAYRLETWYAHNGWFDARVVGWDLTRVRRRTETRAGIVKVFGLVDPGAPSLVREYQIRGLTGSPEVLAKAVKRTGDVQPDAQFNLDAVRITEAKLLKELTDHNFAYARAETRMEAYPEEHVVDVYIEADAGIRADFGAIEVVGADKVREKLVRQKLGIEEGDPYKRSYLERAQRRLYDMGTYSIATVSPDLSDPTRSDVPIAVNVTETKFQTFRAGVGFTYENANPEPRVSTRYRHVNLANQLIRLELGASAGVLYVSNSDNDEAPPELTPTYDLNGALSYPRIARQRITLALDGGISRQRQASLFTVWNPQASLRGIWKPSDVFAASTGPHFEVYKYEELADGRIGSENISDNPAAQAAVALFGRNYVNPYQLTTWDNQFTLDWRDDPQKTTRGSFLSAGVRVAAPLTGGRFSYLALDGDWRIFRPIRPGRNVNSFPLVFAGRIKGRALHALNEEGIPYPELAFMGGPNSIRGYRTRAMGPYRCLCTYLPDSRTGEDRLRRYYLPQGGAFGLESTAELRYDWAYGVTWAAFVDGGVLSESAQTLDVEQDFRWSVGLGGRYQSAIGPIRMDFGFRPRNFPEDQGPVDGEYINCLAGDGLNQAMDLFSTFNRDTRFPVAMSLFLAIGDSL